MAKAWAKLNSKKVYESNRFSIFEDRVVRPDGSETTYYLRKTRPGVVVVPFDGKKIYLINQYRYPLGRRIWELPAGRAENQNFLQQAKKELREETGIRAKSWKYLGQFHASPGSSDSTGKAFLARGLEFGEHQREPGESDIYMRAFTVPQIDRMIARGQITDAWAITPLYFFKQYLLQQK